MNSGFGGTPILMVSGVSLPTHFDGCRCGARKVDVYSYREHAHLRGQCTACGAFATDWIPHSAVGLPVDGRPARFKVSDARRWDVFRRDGFMCVHCGCPAPRSSEAFDSIRSVLHSVVGENKLAVSSAAHAQECVTCGQLLPGVFQALSHEQLLKLTREQRCNLVAELENRRLTIDHIFPESLLQLDGVVSGKKEQKMVSDVFLITACMKCNRGRRATLEGWTEIERVLRYTALRERASIETDVGYAKQIYFRAGLMASRKVV